MILKDDEILMVTQKNGDGALYSTGSINIFHEIIDGYIQNKETGVIVKNLTANEVIDIFNGKEMTKNERNLIKVLDAMSINAREVAESTLDDKIFKYRMIQQSIAFEEVKNMIKDKNNMLISALIYGVELEK